jgi:polyphosphate glucokinase
VSPTQKFMDGRMPPLPFEERGCWLGARGNSKQKAGFPSVAGICTTTILNRTMKILVIDVGGSHVKFKVWGKRAKQSFPSGKSLTPQEMTRRVFAIAADWEFDHVSIGFPGPVIHGKPARDPSALGAGWKDFNFGKHLGRPVKIINDAAMQALGSYSGGRMLFVGLGTGIGSALILDHVVVPLELGELDYATGKTLAEILGARGLKKLGRRHWEEILHQVLRRLACAFLTDYVVVGGGNAELLTSLPRGVRRGSNDRAFAGGARLWGVGPVHAKARKHTLVIA